MSHEFPLMLYRAGSEIEWDGERFDTLIIEEGEEAEDQLKGAKADGWSVGKPKSGGKKAAAKPEPGADALAMAEKLVEELTKERDALQAELKDMGDSQQRLVESGEVKDKRIEELEAEVEALTAPDKGGKK